MKYSLRTTRIIFIHSTQNFFLIFQHFTTSTFSTISSNTSNSLSLHFHHSFLFQTHHFFNYFLPYCFSVSFCPLNGFTSGGGAHLVCNVQLSKHHSSSTHPFSKLICRIRLTTIHYLF